MQSPHITEHLAPGERDALLGDARPLNKPFYRPRPLWLVPFAVIASVSRGMTVAPRVEVFTQLSCNALHGHWNHTAVTIPPSHATLVPPTSTLDHPPVSIYVNFPTDPILRTVDNDDNDEEDPRRIPSYRCVSDPDVQAGAARLQTIMTATMGTLSALTTGWWGHFGERHGRTTVLAISTLGLFLTDLTFILVSTPHSIFATHGHKLLIISPFLEGLLGGWSTLQSATTSYISDCTSDGSRAQIFSRFTGVFYLGLSLGPTVGAFFIHHSLAWVPANTGGVNVTSVFWIAIACSFLNLILVAFVFPESLPAEKRARTRNGKGKARASAEDLAEEETVPAAKDEEARKGDWAIVRIIRGFLSPLAIFLPKVIDVPGGKRRKDWSLTILACALFGVMISSSMYQLKYLYAEHIYGWDAEQLSYYISFMGGARATYLLFVLPFIIATFKPKPRPLKVQQPSSSTATSSAPAIIDTTKAKKPKPTNAQLSREINFDLLLTRFSIMVDILSHTFVTLAPVPYLTSQAFLQSEIMFVAATSLSSFGSGVVPAVQSLALCIMQSRGGDAGGAGRLFGALSVLQAIGSLILGPMLFGLIYSETVAAFPKAIFTTAGAILIASLALVCMVRPEVGRKKRSPKTVAEVEVERGRSRVSKDLSGGRRGSGATMASGSGTA